MSLVTTAHHRHLHSLPGATAAPDPSPRLDLAALGDIVSGLARADDLWRPHVAHDASERVRIRLLSTPAYEVWLLGWTPGQAVGLHDHGGFVLVPRHELVLQVLDQTQLLVEGAQACGEA